MPTRSVSWSQVQAEHTCTRRHWLQWGAVLTATVWQHQCPHAAAWPITAAARQMAEQTTELGLSPNDLQAHAPERYTVQTGDTLWSVAARYLRQPWLWPKLWGLNLPVIKDPHRIFPGQNLCLRCTTDHAWLETEERSEAPTPLSSATASPTSTAIPLLPTVALQPFLQDILLLSADEIAQTTHIVALPEQRQWAGFGDAVYVWRSEDVAPPDSIWDIFSPPQPVTDTIDGRLLGYESRRIGRAQATPYRLDHAMAWPDPKQQVMRVSVTEAMAEIPLGACLYPPHPAQPVSIPPHAITHDWAGQIVALQQQGMSLGGLHQVVMLNRGDNHGLEVGHVLSVLNRSPLAVHTDSLLPRHSKAWLLVFRTFAQLAYAVSVQATDAIHIGDTCVAAV